MARTISQIQTQINQQIQTDPTLGPLLTSTSQTALWNLFSFVVATAIALFEQLQDVFKAEIEAEIAAQPPGTPEWVVKEMLAFQYSSGTPQVVVFDHGVPGYPTVNPDLQIIKHCAVETSSSAPGRALVKVAGSDPTIPLTQGVASITITNTGSGYTSTPSLTIQGGGPNVTATAVVLSPTQVGGHIGTVGQVITATFTGSGYTQTPFAVFSGGGGSGAAASVNIVSALAAAQSYMDVIGFAGIRYDLISLANDWLQITGAIQFDGQYTFTLIQSNVQAAITQYLTTLPFDGVIILSDLIVAIKSVQGVLDVDFQTVTELSNDRTTVVVPMVVGAATVQAQSGTQAGTALFDVLNSTITYQTTPL